MNLPVTITQESQPELYTYLYLYLSCTAVLRAAKDFALVPQNEGAMDALLFLENSRSEILHEQMWKRVHEIFGTNPDLAYQCDATPDFKAFTLHLAKDIPMH